jgi:PAS domain S-box-containing protein
VAINDQVHILIVDDNPKNIQLAANVLKSVANYQVFFATSGEGALALLEKRMYDLILLDIMMPGLDGFETAKRIKDNPLISHIPIIFLTANANQESIVRAFEIGAEDYVTKPFNQLELISRVKTHVELYRIRNHLEQDAYQKEQLLEQYRKVVDIASIVYKADANERITYVNQEFSVMSGFRMDEVIGKRATEILHPDTPESLIATIREEINEGSVWQGKLEHKKHDGSKFITDTTVMPIIGIDGAISEFIAVSHDITPIISMKQEIVDTQKELLYRLGEISEIRSEETGQHVRRVSEFVGVLARAYGMNELEIELLKTAAPMHDVGKIGIPDSLLLKPGIYTDEEFEQMKAHTTIGYQLFKNSTRKMLGAAAIIAHEHHEKWDGTGYPRGLKGENIHIYGRLTAIADVFDALTHERVYKAAWSVEETLEYIKNESGTAFDPKLVELFFENLDEILQIRNRLAPMKAQH